MNLFNYIKDILTGLYGLFQGMYVTLLNMFRPKVTEQYPENRGKKVYSERFRGHLIMPHNELNQHRCTACGICALNCPNGTIRIIAKTVADPETGKEKRVLDRYIYDLGSCIFCALCTSTCPSKALGWTNEFEHTVFTRSKLYKQLNREGSILIPKNKE